MDQDRTDEKRDEETGHSVSDLKPGATHEAKVDKGVEDTFPASDPVQKAGATGFISPDGTDTAVHGNPAEPTSAHAAPQPAPPPSATSSGASTTGPSVATSIAVSAIGGAAGTLIADGIKLVGGFYASLLGEKEPRQSARPPQPQPELPRPTNPVPPAREAVADYGRPALNAVELLNRRIKTVATFLNGQAKEQGWSPMMSHYLREVRISVRKQPPIHNDDLSFMSLADRDFLHSLMRGERLPEMVLELLVGRMVDPSRSRPIEEQVHTIVLGHADLAWLKQELWLPS